MSVSFDTVAKDVWAFMKQPRFDHLPSYFKEKPAKIFSYLLLLDFMLMIPLTSLLGIVGIEDMDHKIGDLADQPWMFAIQAVLLAPIVEEAVFRLPMKYSYVRMFAASCLGLLMLSAFIESKLIMGGIAMVFFLTVALFHFLDQRNDNQWNTQMAEMWKDNFPIPFWILIIAFALLHISNFGGQVPMYLVPILVLPQFVLGAMIGYVRTGFGFVFAVLFHALHNGVLVFLMLFSQFVQPFFA